MSMSIADLLKRNEAILSTHTPIPTLAELKAVGGPPPKTLIVTCMDPRCVPERFFNLGVGEVGVIRNGGGNVRHAFRDITIIDHLFGLEELAIIHHTDCGTLTFTEEQLRTGLKNRVDKVHWGDIDKMVFGANSGLEESVRQEVEWVRAHSLVSEKLKRGVQGFVFDLQSGKMEKVDVQ